MSNNNTPAGSDSKGTGSWLPLLILGGLTAAGIIVTLLMGTREFVVAEATVPAIIPFLWFLLVGYIFSTIGAAGGILAGVGHISVIGMQNAINVRPMNQMTTLVSPFFSVPAYLRQRRLVIQLGILLALGGLIGSTTGAWFSTNFLPEFDQYLPVFGAITLFVAFRAVYETTWRYRRHRQKLREASERFERAAREARTDVRSGGVRTVEMKPTRIRISFFGEEFGFNPLWPLLAGVLIFFVSAVLGVGGGFLLVPFMASILGMPMFVVAGTSLFAILIGSFISIGTYLGLGAALDIPLLTIELSGIVIGSLAGPYLSKYFREQWLRMILALILLYVGIGYLFGGIIQSATGIRII
jgi:uncharacterized membrane protein YfcA